MSRALEIFFDFLSPCGYLAPKRADAVPLRGYGRFGPLERRLATGGF